MHIIDITVFVHIIDINVLRGYRYKEPQRSALFEVAIQYHSAPRTLHLLTGDPLGQTMMKQHLVV